MKKWLFLISLLLIVALPKKALAQQNPFDCRVKITDQCPQIEIGGFRTNVIECKEPYGSRVWCCRSADVCPDGTFKPDGTKVPLIIGNICDTAGAKINECKACFKGEDSNGPGTWTAIGCLPTDTAKFMGILMQFAVGIAGGIAFLLIIFGGFQILTSAGNPEQLNGGKELVTSAVAGLLLIIFSIFILRLIGVNILGLPGFG